MSAPPPPGLRRIALPACTGAVLVAICLVFTFAMSAWYRDVGRALGASSEGVAAALAGEVDRNLELLDFSIRAIADHWAMPEVQALPPRLRDVVLFDGATRAPGFGTLLVLDRDGRVRAQSGGPDCVGHDFSDRDYFRVHAGALGVGLYVSRPFASRVTGHAVVALSRRLEGPDGAFDGVAVGTIEIAYLSGLYAGIDPGPDGAVTLFRTDGTVIARQPPVAPGTRLWAGGGDSFNRMRASRGGVFEGLSPLDGRPRVIAFRRIGRLPLFQAVETGGASGYADWWRRAAAVAGLLTLLCLAVMGLSLALWRELGRRSAAEAELSRLAGTDALTGLANRRRFESAMAEAWPRAAAAGTAVALLMVDVDAFKGYNDLLGHAAGDAALREVAAALDGFARARCGLACRWGGEEFAALLPGLSRDGALAAAEALRRAVQDLALPHPGGIDGVVTVSVGAWSARPGAGCDGRDAFAAADAALYRAKAEGRNRCRAAEGPRRTAA